MTVSCVDKSHDPLSISNFHSQVLIVAVTFISKLFISNAFRLINFKNKKS